MKLEDLKGDIFFQLIFGSHRKFPAEGFLMCLKGIA